MQRYLLRFAYDGTNFLGSQKQSKRIPPHLWTENYVFNDRKTVQGAIESFLIRLRPINEPRLHLASRTDKGVHALSTTAIVDLQRSSGGDKNKPYFEPKFITAKLNDFFSIAGLNIRITKTSAVRGDFSVRRAKCRKYVYRFALRKMKESNPDQMHYIHDWSDVFANRLHLKKGPYRGLRNMTSILPFPDVQYIAEISPHVCMNKTSQTLNLFEGTHNFSSFALKTSSRISSKTYNETGEKTYILHEPSYFIRTINKICIEQVDSPLRSHFSPIYDQFDFYTVEFSSPAFFQNQIRRFMGMAFDVGCGRIDINTIEEMLKNPKLPETTCRTLHFNMAEAKGLHLADVIYPSEDLEDSTDDSSYLPIGNPTEYPSPTIEWDKMKNTMKVTEPKGQL